MAVYLAYRRLRSQHRGGDGREGDLGAYPVGAKPRALSQHHVSNNKKVGAQKGKVIQPDSVMNLGGRGRRMRSSRSALAVL